MDRVRFGRALGTGARAAAKSLLSAAEAAAAPNPSARSAPQGQPASPTGKPPQRPIAGRVQIPDPGVLKQHAGNLKRSVWSPFAKFSSVLWLEVTGVFFLLFALITGQQVWKWHAAARLPPSAPPAQRLYMYTFLFALFGYFTVSSFIRARRRQQR